MRRPTMLSSAMRLLLALTVTFTLLGIGGRDARAQDHDAHVAGHADQADAARPLKLLMVTLGQDMQRIADGIWHEDFVMIGAGARAIASHPRVPSDEMARIRSALGDRFEVFTSLDLAAHDAAVEMAAAAESMDLAAVLDAQVRALNACIACHGSFREEVRRALY